MTLGGFGDTRNLREEAGLRTGIPEKSQFWNQTPGRMYSTKQRGDVSWRKRDKNILSLCTQTSPVRLVRLARNPSRLNKWVPIQQTVERGMAKLNPEANTGAGSHEETK